MRISDWSSDVCSSDLAGNALIDAPTATRKLTKLTPAFEAKIHSVRVPFRKESCTIIEKERSRDGSLAKAARVGHRARLGGAVSRSAQIMGQIGRAHV